MNQALEILGSASDAYVRYVFYSTLCWLILWLVASGVAIKSMRWACEDEGRTPLVVVFGTMLFAFLVGATYCAGILAAPEGAAVQFVLDAIKKAQ